MNKIVKSLILADFNSNRRTLLYSLMHSGLLRVD